MIADFTLRGEEWAADVGDGLVGPAGFDLVDFGSLHLEIDRTAERPLLAVSLDDDSEDDLSGVLDLLSVDDIRNGRGTGVEVGLGDELVTVAAPVARISGELDSVGTADPQERAFEVVALLELVPHLRDLDRLIAGVADSAAAASRAVRLAADLQVRDALLNPLGGLDRDARLVAIVEGAARVAPAVGEAFGWAREPRVENAPVLRGDQPLLMGGEPPVNGDDELDLFRSEPAFRGPVTASSKPVEDTSAGPSPGLPRDLVDGGRFTAAPSAVLAWDAHGEIAPTGDGGLRVTLTEVVRPAYTADRGPLWVRLFSGSTLVGGGALDTDPGARTATTVLAGAARRGVPTSVEVWLNPYRHPSPDRLDAKPMVQLAADALRAGRRAARFPSLGARPRWRGAAERWLAAGYYDRAALAWALAGDHEAARLWARSPAAHRRLDAGVPNPRPACLDWHPDVAPPLVR